MKTVAVRFYSSTNLGDDLLVEILVDRYLNTFKVVHGSKQGTFRHRKNVKASTSRLGDIKNKLAHRLMRKIKSGYVNFNAKNSDIVVYVGGSIFIEGDDLSKWRKEASFYRSLEKPYFILGSNIGPYRSLEFLKIVRNILAGASDVCLRDAASMKLVQDLPNSRQGSDIAFSLDPSKFNTSAQKTAVVSVIDGTKKFDEATTREYESAVIGMTQSLLLEGYDVTYMSFCRKEGDELAISRLLRMLPEDLRQRVGVYKYDGDLNEALAIIASSELVIATRFHASILGFVFGKKVLPMAYSDKTINVLQDMEYDGPIVDIRAICNFDFDELDFQSIPTADISKQKILAEKQFEMLDKVLDKKNS